jgi:uncharacterized repeat protein (TIGR01451 family)
MFAKQSLLKAGTLLIVLLLGTSFTLPLMAQSTTRPVQAPTGQQWPWEVVESMTNITMYSLDMLDASQGWASGAQGALLHYVGGQWEPGMIVTEGAIEGIDAVGGSDVWAATSVGQVFHFSGSAWGLSYETSESWLWDIFMASAGQGWAVGDGGTVLSYLSGHWAESHMGTADLSAIDMLPNLSDGWIVGGGVIFRWVGGRWSQTHSIPGVWLKSVDIVAANDVWAVGYVKKDPWLPREGTIYHWNGSTWTEVGSPTSDPLQAVSMASAGDGWAVGENGAILHYDGQSWQPVPSPVTDHLYDVQMLNADDGWAVGRFGTVLHFTGWPPDLSSSSKHATPARALPNDIVTYDIYLRNTGDYAAPSVVVTDAIPAGTTYVPGSAVASRGAVTHPGPLVLMVDELQPSEQVTFTFQVTVEDKPGFDCWFVSNEAQIAMDGSVLTRKATTAAGAGCFQVYLPVVLNRAP